MEYQKRKDTYVVRLDRGEEVMECLERLCETEGIELAQVSAIAAADEAVIGLYQVERRRTRRRRSMRSPTSRTM